MSPCDLHVVYHNVFGATTVFLYFGTPLRRLRPSPPRGGSSGAGSGSSADALQTFHIQLLIHCSRVALSKSASPLSAGHPSASHPSFARGAPSGDSAPGVDSLGRRFSTSQPHVFFTLSLVFHMHVARGLPGFACAHPCRTLPTAAYLFWTRAAAAPG